MRVAGLSSRFLVEITSLENTSIGVAITHDVHAVVDEIRGAFEFVNVGELTALFHEVSEWNAKVLLLLMIAAAAPERPSADVVRAFKVGLGHESLEVRKVGDCFDVRAMADPGSSTAGSGRHRPG